MKWIYLQILNFFYRINLVLRPAFDTELFMSTFMTGIYLATLVFFLYQGAYNHIFGFKELKGLYFICWLIFASSIFNGIYLEITSSKHIRGLLDTINTNNNQVKIKYSIITIYLVAVIVYWTSSNP